MPSIKDINDYINKLSNHDWHFDYSDDSRVWRAGNEKHIALTNTARSHPMYMEVFSVYKECATSQSGSLIERIKVRDAIVEAVINRIKASNLEAQT